jgi:hypothetical protein
MPNTRRFATATSGTRWPQPSKVKREGLHRAEARGSDDKVTANMAATFCERGKGPSRARRASSHQGGECRSRAAFHSQPMSVAGAPQRFAAAMENSLRYPTASDPASGCRSCRWSATSPRRPAFTRNRPPRLTASGFRDGPKNRHQKSDRSVRGSIAYGLLGNAMSTLSEQAPRISFITGLRGQCRDIDIKHSGASH